MITSPDMYPALSDPPFPGLPGLSGGIPSPIALPNLAAWYKASDFDTFGDGTEVNNWKNSAPNIVNLTVYPINGNGSRPKVSRNSINTTMTSVKNGPDRGLKSSVVTNWLTSKIIWTWFGVVKWSARFSENSPVGLLVSNTEIRFAITVDGLFLLTYGNVANYTSTMMPSLSDWHYIVIVNTSGTVTVYIDGRETSLVWLSTPGTPSAIPQDISVLEANSTSLFQGSIAETGVYDRAITAAELSTLNIYFRTRYGLT